MSSTKQPGEELKKPHQIHRDLENQILILDGAVGTFISEQNVPEEYFHKVEPKGEVISNPGDNYDILSITYPELVIDVHTQYLEAGANIISTNSFNSTSVSQSFHGLSHIVRDLNLASVKCAKDAVKRYKQKNPDRPIYVAGSVGPTRVSIGLVSYIDGARVREVSFGEIKRTYYEQIESLVEGGVDLLLLETVFSLSNLKAALKAAKEVFVKLGKEVPIMVSVVLLLLDPPSLLSGETLETVWDEVSSATDVLSLGVNCSFEYASKPYVEKVFRELPVYTSFYPNAYPVSDPSMTKLSVELLTSEIKDLAEKGLVNIVGGCCGTTPETIAAIREAVKGLPPRKIPGTE